MALCRRLCIGGVWAPNIPGCSPQVLAQAAVEAGLVRRWDMLPSGRAVSNPQSGPPRGHPVPQGLGEGSESAVLLFHHAHSLGI